MFHAEMILLCARIQLLHSLPACAVVHLFIRGVQYNYLYYTYYATNRARRIQSFLSVGYPRLPQPSA